MEKQKEKVRPLIFFAEHLSKTMATKAEIALGVLMAIFLVGCAVFIGLYVKQMKGGGGGGDAGCTCDQCVDLGCSYKCDCNANPDSCMNCPSGATCTKCEDLPSGTVCGCDSCDKLPANTTCNCKTCANLPSGTVCPTPAAPTCKTNPRAQVLHSDSKSFESNASNEFVAFGSAKTNSDNRWYCPSGSLYYMSGSGMFCASPDICNGRSQSDCTSGSLPSNLCTWA